MPEPPHWPLSSRTTRTSLAICSTREGAAYVVADSEPVRDRYAAVKSLANLERDSRRDVFMMFASKPGPSDSWFHRWFEFCSQSAPYACGRPRRYVEANEYWYFSDAWEESRSGMSLYVSRPNLDHRAGGKRHVRVVGQGVKFGDERIGFAGGCQPGFNDRGFQAR